MCVRVRVHAHRIMITGWGSMSSRSAQAALLIVDQNSQTDQDDDQGTRQAAVQKRGLAR